MKVEYIHLCIVLAFVGGCTGKEERNRNEYSSPDTLDSKVILEITKKAESGNSAEQSKLSKYYRELGESEKSKFWQEKCFKDGFPPCLADRAGELISESTGKSVPVDKKIEKLREASILIDDAIERSSTGEKENLLIMKASIEEMLESLI